MIRKALPSPTAGLFFACRVVVMQLITPNPHIPCKPGWCLAYVNEAFRVPKKYGTAMSAWLNSTTQHKDYNFPADVWVPLWFSLANEPAGHVALRAPNGVVWSTTHPTSEVPTRHPNLADLMHAYSFYNPLTYLGWTEDVEDTPVITLEDDIMAELTQENLKQIYNAVWYGVPGAKLIPNELTKKGEWPYTTIGSMTARIKRDVIKPSLPANEIAAMILAELGDGLAADVVTALSERLAK